MIPSLQQYTMSSSTDILVYPLSKYTITKKPKPDPSLRKPPADHRVKRVCKIENDDCQQHSGAESSASSDQSGRTSTPSSRTRRRTQPHSGHRQHQHRHQQDHRRHQQRHHGRGQLRYQCRRRAQHDPAKPARAKPKRCSETDRSRHNSLSSSSSSSGRLQRLGFPVGQHYLRCSANVVLLAHGKRSLHVLLVQRKRSTVVVADGRRGRGRRRRANVAVRASSVAVTYKLPGGRLTMTDSEKEIYKLTERNACICQEDQLWYTTALKHLLVQSPTTDLTMPWLSEAENLTNFIDPQQFLLIGKWYRTCDKETLEQTTSYGKNHQYPYYPYKPAHLSHYASEHKRIYAIPDAYRLFTKPFQLLSPPAKVKTFTGPGGIRITKTKTYKCKFIRLARLHDNNRVYGEILSSLPIVLSGLVLYGTL